MRIIHGIKMYTTAEVAKMLHVTPRTVGQLRGSGQIKYTPVGRSRLISEHSLNAFLSGDPFAEQKARARVAELLANLK